MQRNRAWCFTLNNYTLPEYEHIKTLKFKYLVVGREVGASGTPHLQGYIYFQNAISFNSLKMKLPNAHIEAARGTPEENRAYCTKDGDFSEDGELPKQGKRSDLESVYNDIKDKKEIKEIANNNPTCYIRYHNGIEKLVRLNYEKRSEPPLVYWFYGDTGTGKSRTAYEMANGDSYTKDNSKWWNGYEQQKTIIIDDIDLNTWEERDLLQLLDRYPYQGQTKGGYVQINSPTIIITADKYPRKSSKFYTKQLLRRITKIVNFQKDGEKRDCEKE